MPQVIEVTKIEKVTEVIEVEEKVEQKYDLTWVYVACGIGMPVVTVFIISLFRKCRKQRKIHQDAMSLRKKGINLMFVRRVPVKIVKRPSQVVVEDQSQTLRQLILVNASSEEVVQENKEQNLSSNYPNIETAGNLPPSSS